MGSLKGPNPPKCYLLTGNSRPCEGMINHSGPISHDCSSRSGVQSRLKHMFVKKGSGFTNSRGKNSKKRLKQAPIDMYVNAAL